MEADRHCLRCLFSCINFNDITLSSAPRPSSPSSTSSTASLHSNGNYSIVSGNSSSTSTGSLIFASNNQHQPQQQFQAKLLGSFLEQQLKRPSYIANICYAVDNCWSQKVNLIFLLIINKLIVIYSKFSYQRVVVFFVI